MMQFRVSDVWRKPWTSAISFTVGAVVMLSSPSWLAPITGWYDSWHPVAVPVSTVVIERDIDSVIVHIVMEKKSGDECRLLRVYGYSIDTNGVQGLAQVTRPNGETHAGISHGAGLHDIGRWRIRPVELGAERVIVYAEHACAGRVTRSKIAEVTM